ncbi:MAG: hypothetical protein E6Q97_24020 [Desulfurellales bacterium]|nr:MAG: hypothetical protein E6Q97_24020 [Desulfurellales bacterium]
MALNPRGTRQRDGSAQLSQYREEFRLFGPNSSDPISVVFEVWNEPTVVKIFGVAPGQAVAIDQVSDYSGSPVYAPFTPVRGQPLELTEDLTAVILFYPGRYVLRLTAGGLGTIQAFAYPFSVSHDWGDYYGGLGLGGNVVTSIDETDTNTINITLTPDPGVGDVNIRADAVLSPNAGNILQFLGNGMFVQGPDNGPINVVPTSVLDTATIDMTLAANVLSAVVIRSPDAGQILQLRANGVYVPGPQTGNPIDVPTTVLDTASVDLTLAANVLSADVIISPNAGNQLQLLGNGLFVSGFAGTITTATDTNTIDHTVAAGVLSSQVIISPNAGNIITALGNGLYATVAANFVTSVVDTLSIDLTVAAGVLQADLRIDPSAENVLNLGVPGVIVEAATTAEEEAETAGDLVITALVLGHIVNARTGTQSAHLGVNAGALATRQVSVGYNAGTGVTAAGNVAVGASSGQNDTGASNIYIGDLCGPDGGTDNASRARVVRVGTGSTGASRWQDGSVLIGNGYANAVNVGAFSAGNVPIIVAIGDSAAEQFDFSGASISGPIMAIGAGAGRYFKGQNSFGSYPGFLAIGTSAAKSARANRVTVIGNSAASGYMTSVTTGRAGSILAIGEGAGFSAFVLATTDNVQNVDAIGAYAASGIEIPRKTYAPDTSKMRVVATVNVEVNDGYVTSEFLSSNTGALFELPEIGDITSLNFGSVAAAGSAVIHNTSIGFSADAYSHAAGNVSVGFFAGHTSAQEDSVYVGSFSGVATKAAQCVAVGSQAGTGGLGAAISANFTNTAFNGTRVITTPVHTLTIGEYHVVQFKVIAGSPPGNLAYDAYLTVYALNNTSLEIVSGTVSNDAVGTYSLLQVRPQTNNIAIGYKAENTYDSNNIRLGNDDSETLTTAAKIFPGTDAGAVQTTAGMYAGTGAPNNANGNNGDFYFRADGGALTTIYHKRAGAWVGVV